MFSLSEIWERLTMQKKKPKGNNNIQFDHVDVMKDVNVDKLSQISVESKLIKKNTGIADINYSTYKIDFFRHYKRLFEKENDKYVIKRKKEAGVVPYEAVCTRKTILYDLNFDDGNASFTFNFIHDQLTFNGHNLSLIHI